MTNRINYADSTSIISKQEELDWLRDFLAATDKAPTLENATAALRELSTRNPGAWLVRPDELPDLWQSGIGLSLP